MFAFTFKFQKYEKTSAMVNYTSSQCPFIILVYIDNDFCVTNVNPMCVRWQFFTEFQQFTVQQLDQIYVLVSTAHKTSKSDMTYTVLKAMLKPK